MCLIIYSHDAKLPPRDHFAEASVSNPDGIGVMSADGIAKFLGKRKTRRAWRYVQQLAHDGLPFAVHFRWATHGRVSRSNCHPFEIPGTGAYMMHNGILWTSHFANEHESDTAIFAKDIMPSYYDMARQGAHDYLTALNAEASGNRLLIMHPDGRRFDVINRHLWTMLGGLLYSNTYSITAMDSPYSYPKTSLVPQATVSRAGWLHAPLARGWKQPGPSGPTMHDEAESEGYQDYADDIAEELWQADFEDAEDAGYSEKEAEEYANTEAWRREMRCTPAATYAAAKAAGFDWHDRSTWDKFPIPGTEYAERVLNRHGDGEQPDDYGTPDPRDMFV